MGFLKSMFAKRETASRPDNLIVINAALEHLTATLNTYEGGLIAAIPVSRSEAALITAMKNATKDAKEVSAKSFSDESSSTEDELVVSYLRTTLYDSMQADLAALRAKRDHFAASNVLGIMVLEIKGMKDLASQLFDALLEHAPQNLIDESKPVIDAIDREFESVLRECS